MAKKISFPTLAVILLIVGIVWAVDALGYLDIDFPWLPVVIIIIAIGMIVNRYTR
jgi:hypothetical protein